MKTIPTLLLLATLPVQLTVAQDTEPSESPAALDLPDEGTEVPMLDVGGRPAVEIWIGDGEPLRVLVDTGSTLGLILGPGAGERLGLEARGTTDLGDGERGARFSADVRLGDAFLEGVPVTELEFLPASMGVDGVIGFPCFEQCSLTFDFVERSVRLSPQGVAAGPGAVPFRRDELLGFGLTVDVDAAGRTVPAHVDTGAPSLAMFSNVAREVLPLAGAPRPAGRANTPMGAADITAATLDGDLRLGPIVHARPELRFASLPQIGGREMGNLGAAFFAGTSITIDQRSGLMRIDVAGRDEPAAAAEAAAAATDTDTDTAAAPDQVDPNEPRTTLVEAATTVPMLPGAGNHVLVEVRLNGEGPFPMILDTGAGVTVLNQDLVEELGLVPTGTTRLGDPRAPEAVEATTLVLESLDVGDAFFEGVPAVGWPGSLTPVPVARGVLGFPTFARCLLTLDYPAGTVTIAPGELPEPDGTHVLPMRLGGPPTVPFEVAGVALEAHLDSGNASTVVLPLTLRERIPVVAGTEQRGTGMRASGPAHFTTVRLDGHVRFGPLTVERPMIRFDDALPDPNIGHALMRDLRLTFDQTRGRMRLEKPGEEESVAPEEVEAEERDPEPAIPPVRRRLGVGFELRRDASGETLVVSMVEPASAGASAGLQAGDTLLEIDGESADQPALVRALEGLGPVVLTVDRAGERVELVAFADRQRSDG